MIKILPEKIFTISLCLCFILGLCANYFNLELVLSIILVIILSLCVLFLNLNYKKTIILFLIFIFGFYRAQYSQKSDILENFNSNNSNIIATIDSNVEYNQTNKKAKFYALVKEIDVYNQTLKNLNSRIFISLDNYDENFSPIIGDKFKLKGKIRAPKNSKNPYQFDYKNYLKNNYASCTFYSDANNYIKISSPKFNLKDKKESWNFILQKFELLRKKILKEHSKNIKSPRLEVLGGIVFGSDAVSPDEEIKEQFKASGLLHLLAASGLNVALIYGIWWWFASLISLPFIISILSGAIIVILYTFMTGFGASIVRASLMLLFILFGKIIDREASSLALIFFVGLIMLIYNPKMLFDVGFQLSFVVTIGLITCCPIIMERFSDINENFIEKIKDKSRFQKYFLYLFTPINLISIVAIPLIAQLFALPLQMHYFNNITPLSVLANIAVVPFIGILSFIGFISSIFALIPVINSKIVYIFDLIANPLLALLIKISDIFSDFKYSIISVFSLNLFQCLVFWSLVIIFCININKSFKTKKFLISLILLVLTFLISTFNYEIFDKNFKIVMFDVENADSFLIKTPENKYILIDTGRKIFNSTSSAKTIINQYLKNKRIKTLEYLIITHFDIDHSGGALDILKEENVRKTILQNETENSKIAKEIIKYLKTNNLNYEIVKNNNTIYFEKDLKIKTFSYLDKNSQNESSIITLVEYKNQKILFMADSSYKTFEKIKKYLPNNITILKVGHHGAKNTINKNMLDRIKPSYALISAGFGRFNHPHYSTLNLLEKENIKVISTKSYGFTLLDFNEKENKFIFSHFNYIDKKLEKIIFDKKDIIPFHKSVYFQNFIKLHKNSEPEN